MALELNQEDRLNMDDENSSDFQLTHSHNYKIMNRKIHSSDVYAGRLKRVE